MNSLLSLLNIFSCAHYYSLWAFKVAMTCPKFPLCPSTQSIVLFWVFIFTVLLVIISCFSLLYLSQMLHTVGISSASSLSQIQHILSYMSFIQSWFIQYFKITLPKAQSYPVKLKLITLTSSILNKIQPITWYLRHSTVWSYFIYSKFDFTFYTLNSYQN